MFASPFIYYTPDISPSRSSRRSCAPSVFEQPFLDIDQLNALRTADLHRKQRQQAELRRQYELRLAQIEEYHKQQEFELRRREAYTRKIQEQRRLQAQKQAEEEQRRRLQRQAEAQKYNDFIYNTVNNLFSPENVQSQANETVFDPTTAFEVLYSVLNGPTHDSSTFEKKQEQSETVESTHNSTDVPQEEPNSDSSKDTVENQTEEAIFDPTDILNALLSTVNGIVNESVSQSEPDNTKDSEKTDVDESRAENINTKADDSVSQEDTDTSTSSKSEPDTETVAAVAEEAPISAEPSAVSESASEITESSATSESNDSASDVETPTYDTAEGDEDIKEEDFVLVEQDNEAAEVTPISSKPELTLTDNLNSISDKIDHNIAVYNRVSKHSVEAYSDSESESVSSLSTASESSSTAAVLILRSRIKVLQSSQLELENLYEELDNIETPSNVSDKRLKQVLTGKAVSYADKMDELRLTLITQLENIKANNVASPSTNDSSPIPAKKQSDKSTVRRIMVETVQDEALSD